MTRRAMTLIELLAALVILSAVAAAAAGTLREASASARASALRSGAAEAIALCPDLPRALLSGAREGEAWPREVMTADGRRWRVGLVPPEIDPVTAGSDPAQADDAGDEFDVVMAIVVVDALDPSAPSGWAEAWRFETPVPGPDPAAIVPPRGGARRPRRGRRCMRSRAALIARGLTLIETLASLAILSMLAAVVGVWTSSTLRLQGRIAAAGQDELGAALTALRRDLDSARLGENGPEVLIAEDGASIELVAPPVGAGLGSMAAQAQAWGTVRWSVEPTAGGSETVLIRTELARSESTLVAARGITSMHAELVSPTSTPTGGAVQPARSTPATEPAPMAILIRLGWSGAGRAPVELRWEAAP